MKTSYLNNFDAYKVNTSQNLPKHKPLSPKYEVNIQHKALKNIRN